MVTRGRVTFVTRRAPPATGGMEAFLGHLAPALLAGGDVRILARRTDDGAWARADESARRPQPPFSSFHFDGVSVEQLDLDVRARRLLLPLAAHTAPGLARYAFGRSRTAAAWLFAEVMGRRIAQLATGSALLHAWGPDLLAVATIRAARLLDIPVAVTPFTHTGQWGDDPASLGAIRSADAVLALLQEDRRCYAVMGARPERLHVAGACCPGPVDADEPPPKRPTVLFLGARRSYKGWDILLDAVDAIAAAVPEVEVVFVGPGAPMGDRPHVRDHGRVDEARKHALIQSATVICLPSSHETFGLAVLEGWAASTPAVVSDIPALCELADMGGAVSVARTPAAIAGAVIDLLTDGSRRDRMGAAGHEAWRRNYSVQAVALRHEEVYASLLGRPCEQAGPL